MDFGRGLSYIRQDPSWLVKTLPSSVFSFVPILNFASTGYSMDVIRNVYTGRETPLPEWGENFGDRWIRGLIATVILFIYMLPLVILGCGFALSLVATAGNAVDTGQAERSAAGALTLLPFCISLVIFVAALLLGTLAMVAQARYAVTNDFSAALRFGSVLSQWRTGLGRWFGVLLMTIAVAIPLGIIGLLTCGLGYLLVFYVVLAQSHWLAQAYRQTAGARERVDTSAGTW
jgi:Protein of unknown function (DUF4013)